MYSNGQQLEAYASNVCNAPAFVTAGFYQVKSARELVNQVMPWTDELCLETAFSWKKH